MGTVMKDNLYIMYQGKDDGHLKNGEIYPVESVKMLSGLFGADWPKVFVEFYPHEYSDLFDIQVGDVEFLVVPEQLWLLQELGRVPELGDVVCYRGLNFPYVDSSLVADLMKNVRRSRFKK